MDYKTLRYPGHGRAFRAMLEMGLFDESAWDVDGVSVAPRALLLRAMADRLPGSEPDIVLMRVWARAGAERSGFQLVDRETDGISALARTTAFPATAIAQLLVTERLVRPGANAMAGAVSSEQLLAELAEVGLEPEPFSP